MTIGAIGLLMLACMIAPAALAENADTAAILVRFNYNDGQRLTPRDEVFRHGLDLDAAQDKDGRLLAVRIDLNGDGAPEYFLRSLCGNGGCEYPILDGRTYAYLGTVFGSQVWLLQRRSHALPVIETFSHLSAAIGITGRYDFDGATYVPVSVRQIEDEETQLLYRRLDAAPRIPAD